MLFRRSLILVAVTVLSALAAGGCGDDKSVSGDATPAGVTQSSGKTRGWTATGGSAREPAPSTKRPSKQIEQATRDARAMCEEAANKISNEEAKASTLAACAQFK